MEHWQGKLLEAEQRYRDVLAVEPSHFGALCGLGVIRRQQGRLDDALLLFRQAAAVSPDNADAHVMLGIVLAALDRREEAAACLRKALAIDPCHAAAHGNLGNLLHALGRPREAIAHHAQALAANPDRAELHNNLANSLHALGRSEEAVLHYQRAVAINPEFANAHSNLGAALQALGRLEEARRAFSRAAELAPRCGKFHFNLAHARCFTCADPRLGSLEGLAQSLAALGEDDRIALHFALGKAYADLGRHEQSFRHLLHGNALKRQQIAYDETRTLRLLDRIKATFTHGLMREKCGGDPSPVPIFVVGMPRSGTTLIEQILASHSEVFGAGELDDFGDAVAIFTRSRRATAQFLDLVPTIQDDDLRRIGADYLARIRAVAPGAKRIVDKMPSNFIFAGLIHLVFPNARIIHARRDPVDTCLSCFSLLFAGEQPHLYDLGEMGRYHRAYAGLMEHWRDVLPRGVMLDVQYEDVVDDVERQARRVLAHCGLDWEDACLAFHETRRPVKTASAAQVRQPIYRRSVGRWRPYAGLLRPLLEALGVGSEGDGGSGATASSHA